MNSIDLKHAIVRWVAKIGKEEALKRLVLADVGVAIAQKMVTDRYEREPRFDMGQAILREMAKDGITLQGEVA